MKYWYKMFLIMSGALALTLAPAFAQEEEEAPTRESLIGTGLITEDEFSAFEDDGLSVDEIADQVAFKAGYLEMVEGHGFHSYAFDFFVVSMLWTVMAAALVFLMHLGFATLETGMTRQKNAVNVLFKNVFIISIGIVTYALIGFNMHYPEGDWIIKNVFGLGSPISDLNEGLGGTFGYGGVDLAMTGYGDFIFQAMFAATAATIVSGAVAERIKLSSFLVFTLVLVALAYPIAGSWHWGEGFLAELPTGAFYDFAGSSAVHGFGGFAALGAVLILGPRAGKYLSGGRMRPIPGHNLPLATIGVFVLWFGWFGFNGGSVLSAEPQNLGLVFTTTAISAAMGAIAAMMTSWMLLKKPDITMALNGVLGGLVGITAGADAVGLWGALFIGLVAGIIVVFSIIFFDKVKIDDPVGAISVHGICGIWGTVVLGFMVEEISIVSQVIGTAAFCGFAFVVAVVIALILKAVMGFRVSREEEEEGLDLSEHGEEAYPDFGKVTG